MTYPKALIRLDPSRGFSSDVPSHEVGPDYFTNVRNVNFRSGVATRISGARSIYTTALGIAAPTQLLHALNVFRSSVNYWLLFEADGTAWAIEGENATQIDAALLQSTSNPYEHSSGLLNGVPVYSNGKDEPVYWDAVNLATLPDWTATETCGFLAVYRFHIFAMNISGPGGTFPSLVKWSAAADPGTVPSSWTPAADNDAGDVELADSPGEVLCAYPLRDQLIFYKRSSMYSAQYIGGNSVFSFRKPRSQTGALTPRAVADIDGAHLVVTDGDIVITDGTSLRRIGEARVKNWLFNQLDQSNYLNLFTSFNKARNEVLIGFPESGSQFATTALTYNIEQDSFGVRELGNVVAAPVGFVNDDVSSDVWADRNDPSDVWAAAMNEPWGGSVLSAARDSLVTVKASELIQQDVSEPVSLEAVLGKESMDFGEPERVKFIKRVHVKKGANSGVLFVRVGGQMLSPNQPTTWSNEVRLEPDQQIANCFAMGKYISVQVRSTNASVWRVTGIELEGEVRGYH